MTVWTLTESLQPCVRRPLRRFLLVALVAPSVAVYLAQELPGFIRESVTEFRGLWREA